MARILIVGCGFVGLATARVFASRDWDVVGCTHSAESAGKLAGEAFPVVACDITDRASVEVQAHLGPFDAIIHCASSSRGGAEEYRRVYLEGSRNILDALKPGVFLFTSSTSVYAQIDGGWVTEESSAEPDRETGRLLRETENLVVSHNGVVARLAGVYGPARSVLLRKFFDGTAIIEGGGTRWINQVHRDDIAAALFRLVDAGARGVFNVCDDRPLQQRELYGWLSERFSRPLPPDGPIDMNRKRGWTSKRVSNAKLHALGWVARYPSFFEAVANDPALLQDAGL